MDNVGDLYGIPIYASKSVKKGEMMLANLERVARQFELIRWRDKKFILYHPDDKENVAVLFRKARFCEKN